MLDAQREKHIASTPAPLPSGGRSDRLFYTNPGEKWHFSQAFVTKSKLAYAGTYTRGVASSATWYDG